MNIATSLKCDLLLLLPVEDTGEYQRGGLSTRLFDHYADKFIETSNWIFGKVEEQFKAIVLFDERKLGWCTNSFNGMIIGFQSDRMFTNTPGQHDQGMETPPAITLFQAP